VHSIDGMSPIPEKQCLGSGPTREWAIHEMRHLKLFYSISDNQLIMIQFSQIFVSFKNEFSHKLSKIYHFEFLWANLDEGPRFKVK
jgi:hypothetical protein